MGRIHVYVTIENPLEPDKKIKCSAFVDTGASHMVLPAAWREHLGKLSENAPVELETATQKMVTGVICGPVRIEIEGFRAVHSEVVFIPMEPANGEYDPLVGDIVLEQIPAAVDMLGHRLVAVKHLDLK